MSIADVRHAFNDGLGDAANCTNATMSYVDGGRMQRLVFTITIGNSVDTLTEDVPPGVDLTQRARELATAFVAQIGD